MSHETLSRPSSIPSVHGLAGRIAHAFIDSKLTPLIVVASVLLGAFAVLMLPREEEPQIQVPMIDVLVAMPGSSAGEVEERAARPMEKLLWEVPGVEYLYSQSREGEALTIVRFKVGSDPDASLVKVSEKLRSNQDRMPHGIAFPLIKPRSIDDVPILALTFHSGRYDHLTLRRLASQVDDAVKQVPQVAGTTVIGGARRELRVLLDPVRLASRGLSPVDIIPRLRQANRQFRSGEAVSMNQSVVLETGAFLETAEDVRTVVVGVVAGRPIYLREVAEVVDGAEEPSNYVFYGSGAASTPLGPTREEPAVTLDVEARAHRLAEPLLAAQPGLHGRAPSAGQGRGEHVERRLVLLAQQLDLVGQHDVDVVAQRAHLGLPLGRHRPRRRALERAAVGCRLLGLVEQRQLALGVAHAVHALLHLADAGQVFVETAVIFGTDCSTQGRKVLPHAIQNAPGALVAAVLEEGVESQRWVHLHRHR